MKAMPSKEELISYPSLLAQRILFSFALLLKTSNIFRNVVL